MFFLTYSTRQCVSNAATPTDNLRNTFLLHPSSCYVPKHPPTPLGLRESIRNILGLIYAAQGPANAADYGVPTPATPQLTSGHFVWAQETIGAQGDVEANAPLWMLPEQ
ncbi:hypothetical protein RhiJN_05841 [Ceratobasidium sp. AG-Ba]|nr:hypothetical protein RhiJN_05841 [Ceratobasidium sp. AG-Ba]